jgi:hypothetical protein
MSEYNKFCTGTALQPDMKRGGHQNRLGLDNVKTKTEPKSETIISDDQQSPKQCSTFHNRVLMCMCVAYTWNPHIPVTHGNFWGLLVHSSGSNNMK